jgi:LAO/AO transport system kinase
MWEQLKAQLSNGDIQALARCITLVENEVPGYEDLLLSIPANRKAPVIGITGPPGAGKSTITDALIAVLTRQQKKVAVLCVDPSSPFHFGAILGDRIRMSEWYTNPQVYIRSLASRGSLGGLHPKIIEIADLLPWAGFDYVLIETVGVGQSEVEIAGLADVTVVTIVPEAGDEIQTMKAGLMEVADVFVVNKADRPGADAFVRNLQLMLAPAFQQAHKTIPVIKTIASQRSGIDELMTAIEQQLSELHQNDRKYWLLAERAWQLIVQKRMQDLSKAQLAARIREQESGFQLYQFVRNY